MRNHDYWVYMLTNKTNSTLYIGITNDLERRVAEHKSGSIPGFTRDYSVNRLVWCEHFRDVNAAIACEKKLKGWVRRKKDALIAEKNPCWRDLSADWNDQVPAPVESAAEQTESAGAETIRGPSRCSG